MTNEEKILEILSSMQGDIQTINGRLDSMEGRLDALQAEVTEIHGKLNDLTEAHDETRASVNAILDWSETVSAVVPYVPKI